MPDVAEALLVASMRRTWSAQCSLEAADTLLEYAQYDLERGVVSSSEATAKLDFAIGKVLEARVEVCAAQWAEVEARDQFLSSQSDDDVFFWESLGSSIFLKDA